jgi:hypothetical protein
MKIPLFLSIVALVLSGWSLVRSFQPRREVEEAMESALAKREKEMVDRLKPIILPIIRGLEFAPDKEPETLDELMIPFYEVIRRMSGG